MTLETAREGIAICTFGLIVASGVSIWKGIWWVGLIALVYALGLVWAIRGYRSAKGRDEP